MISTTTDNSNSTPTPGARVLHLKVKSIAHPDRPAELREIPVDDLQIKVAGADTDENLEPRRVGGLTMIPLKTILTSEAKPENYLWEGILPEGGMSLLGGKPKAGKSTIARNLALAAARGQPFLSRATRQGTVLYIALEESRKGVRRHFELMGADGSEPIHIHIGARLTDASPSGILHALIEAYQPKLVIIDTMSRFFKIKEIKDYNEVGEALTLPMELARRMKVHILLLHHLGKQEREDADQILGSTALSASVDTILMLRRSRGLAGNTSTLNSIQRYGEELEPMALLLDEKTEVFVPTVTETESQAKREAAIVMAIIDFLRQCENAQATEERIRQGVSGRTELISRLLRHAVKAALISATGTGHRGDPVLYRAVESRNGNAEGHK
jgi:hypothetical protein